MPIVYDGATGVFHLFNRRISYYLGLSEHGLLQHLYFGSRLNKIDRRSMTDLGWDWSETYLGPDDVERRRTGFYSDRSLMELAPHGANDKRGAPVIIRYPDGSRLTAFFYRSHRIYTGKPDLGMLPCTRAGDSEATSLEFTLTDQAGTVECRLTYTVFENLDVIARNMTLRRLTDSDIRVLRAYTLELDLPESTYDLIHFCGDWAQERFLDRAPLHDGTQSFCSNYGRSSHEENPFALLAEPSATETTGQAYAFGLVYSGNFDFAASVSKWKTTRVLLGLGDFDFEWSLGEELVAPEALLAYSNEGIEHLSHTFHDLIRNNLIRYPAVAKPRPLLFNSWEGTLLTFDTEKIIRYIDEAARIGAELFVLDDGWFGRRDTDDRSLGDWTVNEGKVDLKTVIDHCHRRNMKFGLWFEPEMISYDSDLYRTHPEYALGGRKVERSLSRHQLVLDSSLPAAVDCIFAQMCAVLDAYEIDYVKWDHNRSVAEIASAATPSGEVYHRLVLGTYDLIDRLESRYPHVFFEGCASGGGRYDLGMLCYCPQIWTSDETDPIQRLFIQYGTSFAYPPSTMGAHVSKSAVTGYTTKAEIALFGTYGLEMDPGGLTDSERTEIMKVNEIYHRYHCDVIQNGTFYRLRSPFETNYAAFMSVAQDRKTALVFFANILKENNRFRFLKLRGLDPVREYRIAGDQSVYTGAYLLNVGINLTRWLDEFTSFLFILEAVE